MRSATFDEYPFSTVKVYEVFILKMGYFINLPLREWTSYTYGHSVVIDFMGMAGEKGGTDREDFLRK